MADWNSLLNALNTTVLGAFGRDVTYQPQAGEPFTIRAVFEPAREAEENAPGVYGAIFIRLGDLQQPPQRGDVVTIDNLIYKVFDIETDASGGAVLRLRQV